MNTHPLSVMCHNYGREIRAALDVAPDAELQLVHSMERRWVGAWQLHVAGEHEVVVDLGPHRQAAHTTLTRLAEQGRERLEADRELDRLRNQLELTRVMWLRVSYAGVVLVACLATVLVAAWVLR